MRNLAGCRPTGVDGWSGGDPWLVEKLGDFSEPETSDEAEFREDSVIETNYCTFAMTT